MSSSKPISLLLSFFLVLLLLFTPLLAAPPQLANVQTPPTPAQPARVLLSTRELQRQVLDLLNQNDLVQAENLLLTSLELSLSDSPRVQDWLSQYHQFFSDRNLRRRQTADEHVAQAKEHIQQAKLQDAFAYALKAILASLSPEERRSEDWLDKLVRLSATQADKLSDEGEQDALASALKAVLASPCPQDLRSEDWLDELVQLCAAQADKLSDEGEYGEAALILREIVLIFKDDDSWKQRYEQAGLHASIQGAYGKDSDWQQRLRDVKKRDFERALLVIDKYYVEPVDYHKMLLGALKGFRLFLTTKHLDELFSTEPDQSLALPRLVNYTDQKIDSLNKDPHVTAGDLRKIYYQTISQNRQDLHIPEPILVDLFTNQAFQALDDYTEMIWPDQQEWLSRTITGKFNGIGVLIRINKAKQLEVFTPVVGTPAFKAGLQAADLIVAVDGKTTKGITVNGAVRRITGKKGTTVNLTIKRPGRTQEFDVPIVRDEIKIRSVFGYSRLPDDTWDYILDEDEKIAYIRIAHFMKNTTGQLDQAIEACRKQGARALILDLRFDPGGTLRGAEEVSDRFLPADKVIVTTQRYKGGRRVKSSTAKTLRPDSCAGWPMVVLTSDGSASAAEIVAGALQDHHRAAIVGERTFGKGLVQRIFPLRPTWFDDSQVSIRLTTGYWYLPEGRNVQRSDEADTWGVEPDFHVDLTPSEFTSLYARWGEAKIIHTPNDSPDDHVSQPPQPPADSSEPEGPLEPTAEPTQTSPHDDSTQEQAPLVPDPQLETALLMARLELLFNQNQPTTTSQN